MKVTMPPQFEKLVKDKVESGQYASAEEVFAEAMRLLEWRDKKLAALREDVRIGIEQLERGEYTEYTDETLHELFDEISERGRKWLKSRNAEQSH
ncbi:MAG: type II toxin-antitoxin system ParD family antitoxin [Chloroflexi bacterium]|nr:type II toxin-antitoxin system ParD family antitoxin [Chloroflexota bacterium]